MYVKASSSAGDHVEHARSGDASHDLGDYIGQQIRGGKALADHQSEADCRVQVASRNMADGERHGHDRQAEGKGDAQVSDADVRHAGGKNGGAASSENEPESAEKFRCCALADGHGGRSPCEDKLVGFPTGWEG